ncbi:hypothetical protein Sste5346_007778 [Sporothrix stenoceras]|uniref:Shikimate dehydrogenase substrate binding N-terminal domain-containing protein n=1 Tax=Sporothrix stenoceras TaxID=5173 RepID=A0ABR3YST2_9PEZI
MDILEQSYTFGDSPLREDPTLLTTERDFYIFGGHIAQSLSPRLQNLMFSARGVPWHFSLCQTTNPDDFSTKLHDGRCLGASITMPNKVTFATRLDAQTDEAKVIGAVNTGFVRRQNGQKKWIGTNTDCVGIREAVLARFPDAASQTRGRPAMILGAGGAARSAVYALWRWFGVSEIYVVNRLKLEVDALKESFDKTVTLRYVSSLDEVAKLELPQIIIGTVPDLPPQDADEIRCRAILDAVLGRDRDNAKRIVVDMCYMPSPQTALYNTAAANGWRVVSGTEVVARVCIAQHILWMEKDVEESTVQKLMAVVEESVGASRKPNTPAHPAAKL